MSLPPPGHDPRPGEWGGNFQAGRLGKYKKNRSKNKKMLFWGEIYPLIPLIFPLVFSKNSVTRVFEPFP